MRGIPPFEFLRYMSSIYGESHDLAFYVDHISQCERLEGLPGVRVVKKDRVGVRAMRDDGCLEAIVDTVVVDP